MASYQGKPVNLNGDRFLLTVPAILQYCTFLRYLEKYDLQIENWATLNGSFVWGYDERGRIVTADSNRCNEDDSVVSDPNATLLLRPFLFPLTRSGALDSHAFRGREGSIVTGGYLHVAVEGERCRKVGREASDHWYFGEQLEQFRAQSVCGLDIVDIVESVPDENFTDPPLRWVVVKNGLFCTQPLLHCQAKDVDAIGWLPVA